MNLISAVIFFEIGMMIGLILVNGIINFNNRKELNKKEGVR